MVKIIYRATTKEILQGIHSLTRLVNKEAHDR